MKFNAAIVALLGAASAVKLEEQLPYSGIPASPGDCEPAIDVSQTQLDKELDYFSRTFDKVHYDTAMTIYNELKAQGKDPKVSVHTWELYDKAFSFPRIRRYGLVQEHMDVLEHFQDNLNQNFTNGQAVDNFIRVGLEAQAALNHKYSDGEFSDPALYDPWADHPTTWSNVFEDDSHFKPVGLLNEQIV